MNRTESRRILVIDDTPSIHDDFKKILAGEEPSQDAFDQMANSLFADSRPPQEGQKYVFEVDSAYQGQEGLEMVRRAVETGRPYVMAFVDIRMPPGWDGLETIKRIWQELPNLQIVICTAYSDYSWGELADRLGRSDRLFILKKPFDIVQIEQLAAMTSERSRTENELARYQKHLEELVSERTDQLLSANKDMEQANEKLEEQIVERNRAEETLRKSEEKFRVITENAGDITIIRGRDDKYSYASPSVKKVLGYRPDEVVGQGPGDFVHPHDISLVRKVAELAMKEPSRTFRIAAFRSRHKDGHYVWLEGALVGMPDVECVGGVVVNCRDITERRETEISLQQSEQRYHLLLENSNDWIWEVDLDGQFTFAGPRINDVLGYQPNEVIGKSPMDFILPQETENTGKVFWGMLASAGSTLNFDATYLHKTGHEVVLTTKGVPIRDIDSGIVGYRGISRDVTERKMFEKSLKQSEDRYRLLAENVSDVIWTADMNLNLTYVSPSVKSLRGFSQEEALEQGLHDMLTPDSARTAQAMFVEALQRGAENPDSLKEPNTAETEFKCKDGSTVWAEVRVSFLFDEEGVPNGIIGVTRDISHRRQPTTTQPVTCPP